MCNALLNLAWTVKMSPEQSHYMSPILDTIETLDPIPILGIPGRLLDDSKGLHAIFSVCKAIQRVLVDQSLGRVCGLMAKEKVLTENSMKGDSARSKDILKEAEVLTPIGPSHRH